MNLPLKMHRGLAILGVVIGLLTLSDSTAYGRTRIRGHLYTPLGDVYIESGHRHHRRHYYYRDGRYRHYYYHHHPRYYRYHRHYRHYRHRW
ncbi:MAG TPA: hypothetical protein VHM91_00085 [Verrucomicrobiales bacterium]|nr:hypothetical protein [Verrucomicrobiales bacterium]